jgi:hypothetical protein
MYNAFAFASYSAALTECTLAITRRIPLFSVQSESHELEWEILQFWTRCTNLLRTEDGDNSDETKTRLPHRAECVGRNIIAPARQVSVSCEDLRSRAFLPETR